MKVATRCLGCGKVVRIYGSFSVCLTDRVKHPLTGETKEEKIIGKICRGCAGEAGYKTIR